MEKLSLFGGSAKCPCRIGLDCASLPERRRPRLIPSRFVAVCPKGHIEDFPFMEWIHRDGDWDETHRLRLLPGRSSASLSGIKVQCSCGKSESMAGTFNFDPKSGGALHRIGYDCSAAAPWLGDMGSRGQCGEYLRVLQRGASNVYFPLTISAIYLPLWGEDANLTINRILDRPDVWSQLTTALDEGRYIQSVRSEIFAGIYKVDPDELREVAQKKLDGAIETTRLEARSDEGFRRQEYEALRTKRGGETTELLVDARTGDSYGSVLSDILKQVCLVRKLRETQVLVGFSRLLPVEDPSTVTIPPIKQDGDLQWLPATVVYGEGIFVEFDEARIRRWLNQPNVASRVSDLSQVHNRRRRERGLQEVKVTPKYVLLHTFAHLLIRQLSFDCGYGSASLRERIYCDSQEPDHPMQGVLIYTASGDSEGTLGGLVRMGEPDQMTTVAERAIRSAQWCSSDPVCIETFGQGTDSANLAACHGCALLPETSCELGNRLLDRGLIVGTASDPEIGFFAHGS